jgi:hypothetical protein
MSIYYHFQYQASKKEWLDAGYGSGETALEAFDDLILRQRSAVPIANYVAERLPDGVKEEIYPSDAQFRVAAKDEP